jgi:hypothetical protein
MRSRLILGESVEGAKELARMASAARAVAEADKEVAQVGEAPPGVVSEEESKDEDEVDEDEAQRDAELMEDAAE